MLFVCVQLGCTTTGGEDAGEPEPSPSVVDGGEEDAGATVDAGSIFDAGTTLDAGAIVDAGPTAAEQPIGILPGLRHVLTDVEFGNGVFVAIGPSIRLTSSDGLNWVETFGWSSLILDVLFDGEKFVSQSGSLETSIDGLNWTTLSTQQCATACLGMDELTFDGTRYIGIGQGAYISTDLMTWTRVDVSGPDHIASNASTVVVSDNRNILVSTDGGQTFGAPIDLDIGTIADVMWDGSRFIAAGAGFATSPDGVTWTEVETVNPAYGGSGIAFDGTTYVVGAATSFFIGPSLETMAPPEGIEFTQGPAADAAIGNSIAVVVGERFIRAGNPDL